MDQALIILVLLILVSAPSTAGELSPPFTILEGRHVQELLQPCSRADPPRYEATWQPTHEEVKEIEQRLPLLQQLESSLCCNKGARVKNVHDYYRQYVGIVASGRKLIYINAFAVKSVKRGLFERWRQEPVMVCDGGDWYWGAIYDPRTKTFSQLAFNGTA